MIIFRIFNGFTFMYFHIVKIQGELFNLHTGAKNNNESKNSHVENRIFQENSHVKNHTFSHNSHLFKYQIQVKFWTKSVILPQCVLRGFFGLC